MTVELLKKLKLPILLLAVVLLPLFFGDYVSEETKSFFYALSISMKSILITILPFIIFSFLFYSLLSLEAGAILFIVMLISIVYVSNFTAIITGYTIGSFMIPMFNIGQDNPLLGNDGLQPLWNFQTVKLIANEPALVAGMALGAFFSIQRNPKIESMAFLLNQFSSFFLKRLFMPVLPFFILGFVFKLEHDGYLETLLTMYAPVLLLVVVTQMGYVYVLFFTAANANISKSFAYIRNVLPATITGFSTISSAATMPVSIMAAEKNLNNRAMARTIIPATCNIHTLGSAIGLTILALTTMRAFGMPMPDFGEFMTFAIFYAIAKFAVAGIPGGVIIVVSPLLETYLGFSGEMIGLITAMYLLFDPFGTATNVTCNGAFAIVFSKLYRRRSDKRAAAKGLVDVEVTGMAEPQKAKS